MPRAEGDEGHCHTNLNRRREVARPRTQVVQSLSPR